jgi:hypothetical protein
MIILKIILALKMLDLMDKVAGVLVNIIKTNNSKCS